MNLQRWVLLLTVSVLATLSYAIAQNLFPKWTVLLGLGVVFLGHFAQALTNAVQIPKDDPASKVATSMRPPPLPLLLLVALILLSVACSGPAPKFTPAQEGAIVITGVAITECQKAGKATNSYGVYRRCMCDRHEQITADDCADAGATEAGHGDH